MHSRSGSGDELGEIFFQFAKIGPAIHPSELALLIKLSLSAQLVVKVARGLVVRFGILFNRAAHGRLPVVGWHQMKPTSCLTGVSSTRTKCVESVWPSFSRHCHSRVA